MERERLYMYTMSRQLWPQAMNSDTVMEPLWDLIASWEVVKTKESYKIMERINQTLNSYPHKLILNS